MLQWKDRKARYDTDICPSSSRNLEPRTQMDGLIMIHPSLNLPRDKIAEFCRQHQIKSLSVFGSATREDFRPDSDVDFLVEFEANANIGLFEMVEMQDELSGLLDRRLVDLVTPSVLNNPYRRRAILKDLERVYGA
jgi:predicted nucleotidyltransferase